MPEYLVEVKKSARKSNAAVGTAVCQRGVRYEFDSRDEAESWAADLADDDAHVWIRAANPDDRSEVDAYLLGWLFRRRAAEESSDETPTPGEQAWLADYEHAVAESAGREPTTRRGGERITDWLASE